MSKKFQTALLSTVLLTISSHSLTQKAKAEEINVPTFIGNVKPNLLIRPRYEFVDDHKNKNANALTTRLAIGAQIEKIFEVPNLSAYIEATYVGALVDDYYPQKSGYATVSDPDITRITEAYLKYSINKTSFILGRTRVNLDDQRFIGSVDWRQMPQTFGIIGIKDNTINNLDIFLAGIYERKAVTDQLNKNWKLDKMPILFNISYKFMPQLKLTGYAYLLSAKKDSDGTFNGGNTYGINVSGDVPFTKDVKFSYLGEYAIQKDPYAKDGMATKPKIDADYYRVEAGLSGYGFFGKLGYERFQGADKGETAGFTTPLATLHIWEGWADKFLNYVASNMKYGLRDAYITVGYKHKDYGTLTLVYHKFDADKNNDGAGNIISSKDFGNEIDASYSLDLTKRLNFLVKGAWYNGKNTMPTIIPIPGNLILNSKYLTKYWIQLTYKY